MQGWKRRAEHLKKKTKRTSEFFKISRSQKNPKKHQKLVSFVMVEAIRRLENGVSEFCTANELSEEIPGARRREAIKSDEGKHVIQKPSENFLMSCNPCHAFLRGEHHM